MVPRSPETEAAFRRRLAELDAVLLEPEWLGGDKPHRIVCQKGHESRPRPNSVLGGQGVCRICAGNDSDAAEAAFREALALAGATLLEPSWLGANMPHRILCAKGHEASPRPTHVSQGRGVCRVCRGKTWDVFYVVQDAEADVVKFGITSGDPRPRLKDHRLDGFDVVVRLHKALPDEAAHQLERTVQRALAEAGEEPVRGREYFLGRTLPLILDLVDHHSAIRASGAQVPTG
jgi:hypothetical protein